MRRLAALAAAALLASACGGGGTDAEDVLAETADNLEEIKSGDLSMRLVVTPKGEDAEPFGFELRGPFSLTAGAKPGEAGALTQPTAAPRGGGTGGSYT